MKINTKLSVILIWILFITFFTFHISQVFAQEKFENKTEFRLTTSSNSSNSIQATQDTIKIKDGSGNELFRILDEGNFGSLQMSSGVPTGTFYKLYNNNGVLHFNGNPLSIGGVSSLDDLIDAKTETNNVFVGGYSGLASSGQSHYNVGVGLYALTSLTSGDSNTAVGSHSLYNLTTANSNTAVGSFALFYNNANFNTAVGCLALRHNTSGSSNTGTGSKALYNNTTGSNNVGMGVSSLYSNTTGNFNTAVGNSALYKNESGLYNVGIGNDANYWNQNGDNNTIIGSEAGKGLSAHTKSGNVFIGYRAGYRETGNNKLYISNDSTSSPLIWGDFANDIVKINGEFAVKGRAALGTTATVTGNNSFAIGSNITVTGDGTIFLADNSSSTINNASASNRFIGRFANGYRLWTDSGLNFGAELAANATAWSTLSDSTKKENFKPVDGEEVLNKISKFKLTSWNYKGQDPRLYRHYGPMAQEFFSAFGNDGIGIVGTDTTITTSDIDGINLIAIQALINRNKLQKNKIEDLEKQNAKLLQINLEFINKNFELRTQIEQIKNTLEQITELKEQVIYTKN